MPVFCQYYFFSIRKHKTKKVGKWALSLQESAKLVINEKYCKGDRKLLQNFRVKAEIYNSSICGQAPGSILFNAPHPLNPAQGYLHLILGLWLDSTELAESLPTRDSEGCQKDG